jgi:DNA-directed RNA polymerase specialized sigma24 family protein
VRNLRRRGAEPVEDDALIDPVLLERMRSGDDTAFDAIYRRHAVAVRICAARQAIVTSGGADPDDITAESFFRVLRTVRNGAGPTENLRGYLLTVTRRVAAEWAGRHTEIALTDQDIAITEPPLDRVERSLIATAFTSLPERWRAVLWRTEVQGERPAAVAPSFGLSANATSALARRARNGLRAAYLQAHLSTARSPDGCRSVTERLGVYTAGGLRSQEARRVRAHLADCPSCRSLHAELSDVCAGLRVHSGLLLVPASIGALAAAAKTAKVTLRAKAGLLAASASAAGVIGIAAGPQLVGPDVVPDGGGLPGTVTTVPPPRSAHPVDLSERPGQTPGAAVPEPDSVVLRPPTGRAGPQGGSDQAGRGANAAQPPPGQLKAENSDAKADKKADKKAAKAEKKAAKAQKKAAKAAKKAAKAEAKAAKRRAKAAAKASPTTTAG